MKLDHTPDLYVFALDSADEQTVDTIRGAAAAKAGRSVYRRDLCLGRERLTTSGLKGKARSYAGKYVAVIREAYALLVAEAAAVGFELIECTAADRCKHWGLRRKA